MFIHATSFKIKTKITLPIKINLFKMCFITIWYLKLKGLNYLKNFFIIIFFLLYDYLLLMMFSKPIPSLKLKKEKKKLF